MTNCVVLNRSKFLPPKNNLRYELTHNVYLNLIGADEWEREPSGSDYYKFYNIYDGAFNEVRFRGPDTLSGLMQLRNKEFFDSFNR